jgi:hypothetical protein
MVNVIVRPNVYEQHRRAIRGEPLLWVRGTLAKDDGTVNLLAEDVKGLGLHEMRTSDDPTHPESPYEFLKRFRSVAPGSKDWG